MSLRKSLVLCAATILLVAFTILLVRSFDTTNPRTTHLPGSPAHTTTIDVYNAENGYIADASDLDYTSDEPAIARLRPELKAALRAAGDAARAEGVELRVTSGWRSRGLQQALLDEAISKYGSVEIASQYVKSPDSSSHTRGAAVDIGPTRAMDWMLRFGAAYGLCQAYANELWHFELTARNGVCPTPSPTAED